MIYFRPPGIRWKYLSRSVLTLSGIPRPTGSWAELATRSIMAAAKSMFILSCCSPKGKMVSRQVWISEVWVPRDRPRAGMPRSAKGAESLEWTMGFRSAE